MGILRDMCGEDGNIHPAFEPPSANTSPRSFHLNRLEDASGVSGTGIVANGVEFSDGQCVLHWRDSGSIGVYSSLAKLEEIHGHQGRTLVVLT